ncbi:PQQ-dependent sugar dehydrogenase [Halosimplex salinum]|uniref:PQQ-dependent sugar dehydrogenase n=1 Tax=Halosimplex salinum TaxID=1710538 RepID=UPI000F471898|nr:PQQ-dependent sugar dehydrogenase [Halosimplex salinum]
MTDDRLTRRRALALGGFALASATAGCQVTSDGGPTGETTSPANTDADADGDGSGDSPTGGETDVPSEQPTEDDGDETGTSAFEDLSVGAERVASGFTSPIGLEIPQVGRRFVVDQTGQIYLQDGDGVHKEPFLDVSDRMVDVSGYSEQGLLGLAFHPAFEENGRFFVRYSAPSREGTPDGYSHTFVLSAFEAEPDGTTADPDSERTILEIPQPQANHNAGAVAFGPDGYLYVATGDGGRADDQGNGHVEDWYDAVGGGNGQDVTENLLGSILRIDVDSEATQSPRNGGGETADEESDDEPYAVPDDNPLVGEDGLDEQYAWGFRNPWRFSFGPDGRLFVADVGQGAWEEVSVVESGGNYGWNVREGSHCFQAEDCPDESPRGRPLEDPVIEYPHGGSDVSGIAVIGGYLYDGDAIADLRGRYLFADWRAQGRLYAAREPDGDDERWPTTTVSVESDEQFGPMVLSFGRNPEGELFVCTTAEGQVTGETGAVFRLTSA